MWVIRALEQFLHRYGETLCCKRGEQNSWTVHGILTTVKDNADAPGARRGGQGDRPAGAVSVPGGARPRAGRLHLPGKKGLPGAAL